MSFNTLDFMLLLAGTLILYFLLPQKLRNPLLLVASYVFYAAYSLGLTLFLVIMTLITYVLALEIDRCREVKGGKVSKAWMIVGVVISLGTLAFYKYFNFLSDALAGLSGAKKATHLSLLVPLGISFVVFTLVSYLVDVYRGKIPAERNILKYALFVSFFPKVVQGPIEKAGDILPQFDEKHSFDILRFRRGMLMVLYGLFMKMVVADTASVAVDTVYNSLATYGMGSSYHGAATLAATLLFTFQIYCDFAGYSLVAIGSAYVMGFNFKQNFRQPYLSLSVAEFWRRWHISLNRWLIDYLYIPLGGSRCKKSRKYYNTMVTFGLSGLWHGADWGYIVWGLLNGLYIVIESELKLLKEKIRSLGKKEEAHHDDPRWTVAEPTPSVIGPAISSFFHRAITFILIMFSWIFFRAQKLSVAMVALRKIFTDLQLKGFITWAGSKLAGGVGSTLLGLDVVYRLPILLAGILVIVIVDRLAEKRDLAGSLAEGSRVLRWIIAYALIFAIMIFGVYGYGYSAGAFIYAGF
ncbi:MAG: MBOAT family protein [Oscillospiraceae bacterium]|nr:MBOAT family protein [Oscillospiraceae bacterium]